MASIEIKKVEKNGTKVEADVVIGGKPGSVTMYSDGSLSSSPAWIISRAGGSKSDAQLAVRNAIRAALDNE